jgi:hypothetical protein
LQKTQHPGGWSGTARNWLCCASERATNQLQGCTDIYLLRSLPLQAPFCLFSLTFRKLEACFLLQRLTLQKNACRWVQACLQCSVSHGVMRLCIAASCTDVLDPASQSWRCAGRCQQRARNPGSGDRCSACMACSSVRRRSHPTGWRVSTGEPDRLFQISASALVRQQSTRFRTWMLRPTTSTMGCAELQIQAYLNRSPGWTSQSLMVLDNQHCLSTEHQSSALVPHPTETSTVQTHSMYRDNPLPSPAACSADATKELCSGPMPHHAGSQASLA